MASLTITTNLKDVLSNMDAALKDIFNNDYLLRPVAIELIPMITERIHQRGQGSDGTGIGTYSSSYLSYRNRHNRGKDTKVIVSLTRQLENDWSVLETPKGYGIGFTNSFNADKLGWVEDAKDKVIRELTTEELQYAEERINELITDAFNK